MDPIMITGGQGFTGRYITQRLAASGHRIISYTGTSRRAKTEPMR